MCGVQILKLTYLSPTFLMNFSVVIPVFAVFRGSALVFLKLDHRKNHRTYLTRRIESHITPHCISAQSLVRSHTVFGPNNRWIKAISSIVFDTVEEHQYVVSLHFCPLRRTFGAGSCFFRDLQAQERSCVAPLSRYNL
jgi:hypothetical protein